MMKEKITHWITPKRIAFFLTIVYLGSLIPVLWIGWYNYPSADDYSIGSNCRQVWVNSHNLFAVLGAGIARAAEDWVNWMGYFTSNFLMAVPPSVFGERFYVLTVWIMVFMLSFSTWYLLRNIFVKVFQKMKIKIIQCHPGFIPAHQTVSCHHDVIVEHKVTVTLINGAHFLQAFRVVLFYALGEKPAHRRSGILRI